MKWGKILKAHRWVVNHSGKADHCENNSAHKGGIQGFHWANIGHTYHHNISEWIQLCRRCHWVLDHPNGKVPIKTKSWKNNKSMIISFRLPNTIIDTINTLDANTAIGNYCKQVILNHIATVLHRPQEKA